MSLPSALSPPAEPYLGCGLCCVIVKPGFGCDHCQYLELEVEREQLTTVVVKQSFFGNETKEVVKTVSSVERKVKCRCGYYFYPYKNADCYSKLNGYGCSCRQELVGDTSVCAKPQSEHICSHGGVKNKLQWLTNNETRGLHHPLDLQYRKHCTICQSQGVCNVQTYQPCVCCQGTGGLRCPYCPGLGAIPRHWKESFEICKKCDGGYKERCVACNGERAIRDVIREVKCTRCVVIPPTVIRPINSGIAKGSSVAKTFSPKQEVSKPLKVEPDRPISPSGVCMTKLKTILDD